MSAEFSFLFMIFFGVTTIHKKDLKNNQENTVTVF